MANRLHDKVFLCRLLVYVFTIVWGCIQAWNSRFELFFADSQQYFDVAGYFSQGEFAKAVSLYWSPLYPALLGLAMRLVPVPAYWMFFEVKIFNLICVLGTFFAFEFFFVQLYRYYSEIILVKDPDRAPIDRNVLLFTGYALLLENTLAFGGVHQDTPDMLTAALFFISGGFVLRQLCSTTSKLSACLLGISLGFGYLCKAVFFSMTAVYLGLMFIFKRNIVCLILTAVCFALLSAPWVWIMSNKAGHLSFGESAKFVYINLVEERDPVWTEGAIHHPKILHRNPTILDYGDIMPGTTPLMYDYGYWAAGAVMHVEVDQLLHAIVCNLIYFIHTLLYIPAIVVGYVAIRSRTLIPTSMRSIWLSAPIWVPPLALYAQYTLISNLYLNTYVDRYFIAANVIAMLGVLIALRVPRANFTSLLRAACVLTAGVVLLVAMLTRFSYDISNLFKDKQNIWYNTAMALKKDGIKSGDAVSHVGVMIQRNYQFLEPEKLRLTTNIRNEATFWQLTPAERDKVLDIVRKAGARAVVYARIPDLEPPLFGSDLQLLRDWFHFDVQLPFRNYMAPTDLKGWKQVPGCEIYYYLLDDKPGTDRLQRS